MLRPIVTKKRVLQILTRSSGNDRASRICDRFLSTMILLNLIAVSMESVSSLGTKYGTAFYEGFRMFYISCVEAFGANHGNEFMCGYYTFVKRA